MVYSLSSVTLTNAEKVPLSFCCSGGIALNLNFVECPLSCNACPWEANLSQRSAELLNVRHAEIVEIIDRYSPDIVMLHGGEPYTVKGVDKLLEEIRGSYKGFIGIKANIFHAISAKERFNELLHYSDLVLAEFVDVHFCQINQQVVNDVNYFLHSIFSQHKGIEVIAVATTRSCTENLINVIIILKEFFKNSSTPLNWIFLEATSLNYKLGILDRFRELGIIAQAPLEDSVEIASTFCKACRNPIILRQGGQLIRLSMDRNGVCKYCGYRYENFKYAKRIVRNPIEIQIL
jgi:organic radical activating enzyme